MNLSELFAIKQRLLDEAMERAKLLPEADRLPYIHAHTDGVLEFFVEAHIKICDEEAKKNQDQKSA